MDLQEQEIKRRLGAFLREVRERRGFSLADIATATGRSRSYVCDVEAGRRGGTRIPADIIALWAGYLNVPVSAIAEIQRARDSSAPTNTQRYRSYMRILRNRTRSLRIYKAVGELRELVKVAADDEHLSRAQTREIIGRVSQAIDIIDSCLAYNK